jgi:hypothetical protein
VRYVDHDFLNVSFRDALVLGSSKAGPQLVIHSLRGKERDGDQTSVSLFQCGHTPHVGKEMIDRHFCESVRPFHRSWTAKDLFVDSEATLSRGFILLFPGSSGIGSPHRSGQC